jgi:spore coat polysaccharide biosynthesis predicted glycosyltransferase SpsG
MKNKTKVILRADGNKEIGMGHFIRSLALAEMINKKFTCILAFSQPSEYQKKEALQVCESIIELPGGDLHYKEFLNHINPGDIIVLDNYFYDTGYQNEIKRKGCKLVCIDDTHDKHYAADIVINQSPSVTEEQFDVENYTKLLLGTSYTLLRKEFLEHATHQPSLPSNGSVLLCFGGIDKYNLSLKYINLMIGINPELRFNVVAGAETDSYRSMPAEIVGHRHQHAAMQYPVGVAQLPGHGEFGFNAILG